MKIEKKKNLEIITSILFWIFVFVIPLLMFWRNENVDMTRIFRNHAVTVISAAIVYYVNSCFLIDKYLLRKKALLFILSNIVLILAIGELVYLLKEFRVPHPGVQTGPFKMYFFYFREVFSLIMVAGLTILIRLTKKWFTTETQRQEEEKKRKEAELQNLRQQINPHFFFNTLNNIYALIEISPEKAQQTVLDLSKLMRYVLYENNNNFVPVNKEIDFIKNYIDLMRIRLTKDIDLKTDIQIFPMSDKVIAPMIFITLIENAFKHGVSYTNSSFIHIDIRRVDVSLVCVVRNSYFPKDKSDKSGSGIGLENLKKRLDILYPHEHILRMYEENNIYTSELIIPLHEHKKQNIIHKSHSDNQS